MTFFFSLFLSSHAIMLFTYSMLFLSLVFLLVSLIISSPLPPFFSLRSSFLSSFTFTSFFLHLSPKLYSFLRFFPLLLLLPFPYLFSRRYFTSLSLFFALRPLSLLIWAILFPSFYLLHFFLPPLVSPVLPPHHEALRLFLFQRSRQWVELCFRGSEWLAARPLVPPLFICYTSPLGGVPFMGCLFSLNNDPFAGYSSIFSLFTAPGYYTGLCLPALRLPFFFALFLWSYSVNKCVVRVSQGVKLYRVIPVHSCIRFMCVSVIILVLVDSFFSCL